jgi:hypothetical protein
MTRSTLRSWLAGLAASLGALSPSAQALDIVFRDVTPGGMTSAQLAGFQAAGNYWESQLADNITVYVDISFASLGSGVLGSASTAFGNMAYADVRSRLAGDAKSALDGTAVSKLPNGPSLSFWISNGSGGTFDNNGSDNNRNLLLSTANAKALGVSVGTTPGSPDGSLQFSSDFAFAYSRNDPAAASRYDFITVAEHEIGHLLGFVSSVDRVDRCFQFGICGAQPGEVEANIYYTPLDLFRYSADGRDMRVGGSPFFAVDGTTSIEVFSTGEFNGNGNQASHFGGSNVNLMAPRIGVGQAYDASARDLAAFDAIGWDLAVTAVPEPRGAALLLAGLAVVGFTARRRRR